MAERHVVLKQEIDTSPFDAAVASVLSADATNGVSPDPWVEAPRWWIADVGGQRDVTVFGPLPRAVDAEERFELVGTGDALFHEVVRGGIVVNRRPADVIDLTTSVAVDPAGHAADGALAISALENELHAPIPAMPEEPTGLAERMKTQLGTPDEREWARGSDDRWHLVGGEPPRQGPPFRPETRSYTWEELYHHFGPATSFDEPPF